MNRKRALIALSVFALAALVAFGAYGKRRLGLVQDREVREIKRAARGVLPTIRSTVPGVSVTGTLRQTGRNNEYEAVDLVIRNETDSPVEAIEVSAPPEQQPTPGTTATLLTTSRDKRRPQFPGDHYKLKPAEPLIGPHGQMGMDIMLSMIPDGSEIVLSAAAFGDGRVLGSRARDFERQRAREAKEGGPSENSQAVVGSQGKNNDR